jgi:predicted dithiol-disulfide oxidoreductase (DUF899 family)
MENLAGKQQRVVWRDEWDLARRELLAREKELTRLRDAVSAQRRRLPMVLVNEAYSFEGADGFFSLPDLFEGRRQLIVYHMMWRWDLDAGCPSCSYLIDGMPHPAHLNAVDTTLAIVTRGPWPDVDAFRSRMGWIVPCYSSYGSDFNYDFHATLDESIAPVEYNYRSADEIRQRGDTWQLDGELPAASVFLRDGDDVFHTYSAYSRGLDGLISAYNFLDLTPLGRQRHVSEVPHRYAYGTDAVACDHHVLA